MPWVVDTPSDHFEMRARVASGVEEHLQVVERRRGEHLYRHDADG